MIGIIIEKIQDDGERYLSEKETHLTGGNIGVLGFSVGLQFTKEVQESKNFQYKLSHLCQKKEIDAFFAKAFNELGIQISPSQRIDLTKATFGSPYMLQLVGYNICLYANDDGSIDESLIESAL